MVTKLASAKWRSLSRDEKAFWDEGGNKTVLQHQVAYPDYKYRPVRSSGHSKGTKRSHAVQAHSRRGRTPTVPPSIDPLPHCAEISSPCPMEPQSFPVSLSWCEPNDSPNPSPYGQALMPPYMDAYAPTPAAPAAPHPVPWYMAPNPAFGLYNLPTTMPIDLAHQVALSFEFYSGTPSYLVPNAPEHTALQLGTDPWGYIPPMPHLEPSARLLDEIEPQTVERFEPLVPPSESDFPPWLHDGCSSMQLGNSQLPCSSDVHQ
ncbi:hypothetical protein BDW22DRAFT_1361769 [Trametopsis cervina]|nr:hypothetical protein BDW22DRAFT_1361769 [Trametopsis cervina]